MCARLDGADVTLCGNVPVDWHSLTE